MTTSSLLALILLLPLSSLRAETVIKFATLAPEGSTWMKAMNEFNKEIGSKTGGQVRFKFYPGGVSGDERDVVRKMRLGQLQAAGLTGVGIGEIAQEIRVLDSPWLFRNAAEVDGVIEKFDKELSQFAEKKGFIILGWTEVGFAYFFTAGPVKGPEDLKTVKMWMWEGDTLAESAFRALGVHPIPLSITDVMTSLQTGLINGVYCPPMAAIALQWFAKTKFVHSVPVAYAMGAVLVSKKTMDSLPADLRKTILETGRKHMRRITELSREENRLAFETLKKEGLTVVEPTSPDTIKRYEELGKKARRELAGRIYPLDLLNRVEAALEALRGKKPSGKSL